MTTIVLSEQERLINQTVKELRDEAKRRGLKGYSTKNKLSLVEMLLGQPLIGGFAPPPPPLTGEMKEVLMMSPHLMNVHQLKEAIKTHGGKGYSGKSKKELVEMLITLTPHIFRLDHTEI